MKVRIHNDDRYNWEPRLRGHLAESTDKPNTFRLLEDTEYIREHTDGFVILAPGEYEVL